MGDELRSAYGRGRLTAQRAAIARAVTGIPSAFTVEELAAVVRRADSGAGATATVYRAVAAMESSRFVERVGSRNGSVLYARCATPSHHHHIVCDGCGRIAHAECPVVAGVEARRGDGFVITRHEVTLYGLCPECAEKNGGA